MEEELTATQAREKIEGVRNKGAMHCLMACYLWAGRVSEVVGLASPRDTTVARGPRGTDVRLEELNGEELALFSVKTAKRGGKERNIALPMNPNFELWTKQLYEYFEKAGTNLVFPFRRQKAWEHAKEAFGDHKYSIDEYKVYGENVIAVKTHKRDFRLHALRHLRASELVSYYGFDAFNLSIYAGWKLSGSMARYLELRWQDYFPKLLKRRRRI